MEDFMRAVRYHEYGDPQVLNVEEAPEPHAGPGQVRIRAAAASVNPVDWKCRAGYLAEMMPRQFPVIPGYDAAGVVDEVGEGASDVGVGDTVLGLAASGGTAEHVILSAWAPVPEKWNLQEAAGAGFAGATAVRTLNLAGLSAGQTLLVEGAAGGVGSIAAQVAVARGLSVIGTASETNHDYLRSIGVVPTTYGPGLAERVAELAPAGVDGALDTAGSGSLTDLIRLVDQPGKVVSIADYAAPSLGARFDDGSTGNPAQALSELTDLGAAGQLQIAVADMFPAEQAAEAHALSQTGHVRGKLVITL
jgi:NADPH:quinone reductase-like Zn-dependent oxidoreductase